MADPNQAVFDVAKQTFVREVVAGAQSQAVQTTQALRDQVDRFVEGFYRHLVHEQLPARENSYAPLEVFYSDRKLREQRDGGFFSYRGNLLNHLLERSAVADFGKTRARLTEAGSGLRSGFTQSGGAVRIKKGLPGAGQYASPSLAFVNLVFTAEIQIFPKLASKNDYSVFDIYPKGRGRQGAKIRDSFRVTELGQPGRNQPPRALLIPSLKDFREDRLPLFVKTQLGLDLK